MVTHLAAPGFFFLMGIGMTLYRIRRSRQGQSRVQIVGRFWLRGTLLVALQFLIVNQAWRMSPGGWGPSIHIGVLFALGGTMIISSLLLWLKADHLLLMAVVLFIVTEVLKPNPARWSQTTFSDTQLLLLYPGGDIRIWSNYSIVPWLEVVLFGLAYGQRLSLKPRQTYQQGLLAGVSMLLLFVVLRALNGFGNIRPMLGTSWIDFLNVVKYPPSWCPPSWTFTLPTIGANLVLMWAFSRIAGRYPLILRPLAIYGSAPLFFDVSHLFLYGAMGALLFPGGSSIPAMLPLWLVGLAILLPLCVGYFRLRRTRSAGWLLQYF